MGRFPYPPCLGLIDLGNISQKLTNRQLCMELTLHLGKAAVNPSLYSLGGANHLGDNCVIMTLTYRLLCCLARSLICQGNLFLKSLLSSSSLAVYMAEEAITLLFGHLGQLCRTFATNFPVASSPIAQQLLGCRTATALDASSIRSIKAAVIAGG